MSDIVLGLAVLLLVSAWLFYAATLVSRRLSRSACRLLALLLSASVYLYVILLWDSPLLALVLPYSNLIVVGNWFLPAAAFLAGLVWQLGPGGPFRRGSLVGGLALVSLAAISEPLVGTAPDCGNEWTSDGICVQTTDATCSPACAASLLQMHGIATSEQEMAELCLTRKGTRWQGLYRGLKHKTQGTCWDVEVFECSSAEIPFRLHRPVIAAVGMTSDADPDYENELGFRPDVGHSVLMLGRAPCGGVDVVDPDPDYLHESWSTEMVHDLWQGHAIRLVRRDTPESPLAAAFASLLP